MINCREKKVLALLYFEAVMKYRYELPRFEEK